VHEDGFGIRTRADGQIYCVDPQGKYLPETGETCFSGNAFELTVENGRRGIRIMPETGECRWGGEVMDDNHAVLGMLQLE